MKSTGKKSKNKIRLSKKWRIILIVIVALVLIRLALPYVVLHYANRTLETMDGYYGQVEDIDLSIYRGAYQINDIYINKVDSVSQKQTPFFASRQIDLSVEWNALFNGRIVGELEFNDPMLRFTKDEAEPGEVQKDTTDFRRVLDKFMPLKINRFEVHNGQIQYVDHGSNPKVDISMKNTYVLAQNLSSVKDTALLPATIKATASVYRGTLDFNMKIDPLADDPTYDFDAEVKNVYLPDLNDFFKAYAKVDVNKGTLGLYTEIAAKDRKFKGYVKPILKDVDVAGPEDRGDTFIRQLWEGIVGTVATVLKNPKEKQVATKIPIEGKFGETSVDTWYAIMDVLRNAFIQAIYPALDYQITIADVEASKPDEEKGFFKKLFGKKNKNEDKEELQPEKEKK